MSKKMQRDVLNLSEMGESSTNISTIASHLNSAVKYIWAVVVLRHNLWESARIFSFF